MTSQTKIAVTVKDVKGNCVAGHKVGDAFEVSGTELKGYVCPAALNSFWAQIYAMKYGVVFPWAEPDGSALVCCPDPKNLVTFELRRVSR